MSGLVIWDTLFHWFRVLLSPSMTTRTNQKNVLICSRLVYIFINEHSYKYILSCDYIHNSFLTPIITIILFIFQFKPIFSKKIIIIIFQYEHIKGAIVDFFFLVCVWIRILSLL